MNEGVKSVANSESFEDQNVESAASESQNLVESQEQGDQMTSTNE